MQYVTESPSALKQEKHEIVEIKLWGLYLLINQNNLYSEMIDASLDHGPVEKNPQKPGYAFVTSGQVVIKKRSLWNSSLLMHL